MNRKTYGELISYKTFDERYEYLRIKGEVGSPTFGFDRYLNQLLYKSRRWKTTRNLVIVRDYGCDLAVRGYEIGGQITIHHMNPITADDIENGSDDVFDLDGLVCVTPTTHLAIHYGDKSLLVTAPIVRRPGDTTLWRKNN